MPPRAGASLSVQYEISLNEALCASPQRGDGRPSAGVVAKCCNILDDMEDKGAFGAYNTVVSQLKKLLYRAVFSDDVTTDSSGLLQKVAYTTLVDAQGSEIDDLKGDLRERDEQLQQKSQSLTDAREKSLALSEQLDAQQRDLEQAAARYAELESECARASEEASEQDETNRRILACMSSDLAKESQRVAAARQESAYLRQYVDNHEANRKAFLDMQMYRRTAGKREDDDPDDLHEALTLENQIVMLLNMRIEEFERMILDAAEETTDRLRARFVQEMAVLNEELASIRKHIAQLGREGVIADVAAPMRSLIAGSGTVFRIEEEVSVSMDNGRTFAPVATADEETNPSLRDQFLHSSTFAVNQGTGAAAAADRPAVTHVQVKLKRHHENVTSESRIPLSELPAPLGTGALWELYRRKNGHISPKRPKVVSLPQLLRTIDEVYRCKYILEDMRGSATSEMDILDDFFFEHMEMTYGEEWISLHVVHGIFCAVEKYREAIPTVEMFYQSMNAQMDDSGWRYIRLCREVAEKVSGNEGVRTVEQLRKFLSQLYWDASIQPNGGCSMTAIDIQNSEKEFLLFAEQYSGEVTSASSASRKGAGDDEFTEETVYEFLTKKILDGKEHRYTKIRKKLIAFDVLQRNCLKQTEFIQFINGHLPKAPRSLPIMLFRGASAMLHKAAMLQGSTFDQKVELSSLALVTACVEISS